MLRRIVTGAALTIVSLFVMGGVASATTVAEPPSAPTNVTVNLTINNLTVNFVFNNSTIIINGGGLITLTP
jgi:hypothetical protein